MDDQSNPFFYRPKVKKILWRILIACCIVPVLIEIVFLHRHSHFSDHGWLAIDGAVSFYAMLGFFGCTILIFVAKLLGAVLKVGETYYNDDF